MNGNWLDVFYLLSLNELMDTEIKDKWIKWSRVIVIQW